MRCHDKAPIRWEARRLNSPQPSSPTLPSGPRSSRRRASRPINDAGRQQHRARFDIEDARKSRARRLVQRYPDQHACSRKVTTTPFIRYDPIYPTPTRKSDPKEIKHG